MKVKTVQGSICCIAKKKKKWCGRLINYNSKEGGVPQGLRATEARPMGEQRRTGSVEGRCKFLQAEGDL